MAWYEKAFAVVCLGSALGIRAQPPAHGMAGVSSSRHVMVGVRARLEHALDARKVQQGDPVVARPEAKVRTADGFELNAGCMLLGHVDKVQRSTDKGGSAIAVTFDKVRLKDRQEIAIKGTILWIGEPPDVMNPTIRSAPADRTTPGVGVEAGDTQTPPMQGYQGSEIAGWVPPRGNSGAGEAVSRIPGVTVQRHALPGVNLFSDVGRPDSAWFRSERNDVSVPSGTVFAFLIVTLPSTPTP